MVYLRTTPADGILEAELLTENKLPTNNSIVGTVDKRRLTSSSALLS